MKSCKILSHFDDFFQKLLREKFHFWIRPSIKSSMTCDVTMNHSVARLMWMDKKREVFCTRMCAIQPVWNVRSNSQKSTAENCSHHYWNDWNTFSCFRTILLEYDIHLCLILSWLQIAGSLLWDTDNNVDIVILIVE